MEKKIVNQNIFGYITEDGQEVLSPFGIFYDKWAGRIEQVLIKIDHTILGSKPVVSAASAIIANTIGMSVAMQEATRTTVRLYSIEGVHLSRKNGEQTRMTWYTNPITAIELGEYMGHITGRLVYIDLKLDCLSDYSHRFYKRGNEAYTLKGDLIKVAKNKWKYVRSSGITEVTPGGFTEDI